MAGRKKKPAKKGRRTLYDSTLHPAYGKALAIRGLTNKQIAECFGIAECTLQDWVKKHQEFSEAIKEGKGPADARVEMAGYKAALGYFVDEKRAVVVGTGEHAHVQYVTESRYIPPNFQWGRLWAKNRMGWSDSQEVKHSGQINWMELVKSAGSSDKPE